MKKVDDNTETEGVCARFCGECPSFPGKKGELLFCARGASATPKAERGCNCGSCGVWEHYGLGEYYYCKGGKPG